MRGKNAEIGGEALPTSNSAPRWGDKNDFPLMPWQRPPVGSKRPFPHLFLLKERAGIKVDVLLCCGDFEANRDAHDLSCMNVPPKYLHMGDFPKYYRGSQGLASSCPWV